MMSGAEYGEEQCYVIYSIARYVLLRNTLLFRLYPRNYAFHFWIQQFETKTQLLLLIINIKNIVEHDKIDTDFPP